MDSMKIGEKIRALRKEKNMTLQELSKTSGVALATLSRIENNHMTGTLESHMNICRALQITLPQLYSDIETEEKTIEFHPGIEPSDVYVHTNKSSFDILATKVLSRKMMPIMLKVDVGGQTNPEEAKPGTEKFVFVLKGRMEIKIGDKVYILNQGDSLYFDASLPHCCKNKGSVQVKCICVITPPAL